MFIKTRKFFVALIVLNLWISIVSITNFSSLELIKQSANASSLGKIASTNIKNQSTFSCSCVAFRLDDVMDYSDTKTLLDIMDVFRQKNSDLTIGVVGNEIGADQELVSYINKRIMKDNDTTSSDNEDKNNPTGVIQVANHSWKHENFSELTVGEMSSSISKTNEKIRHIFGVEPSVFIAPNNEFKNDIFYALRENKMLYFSASKKSDPPPYNIFPNATIYHLPQTAYTGSCKICGDGVKNASWYAVPHEITMKQITSSLRKYGFAVVTLHAWEYSKGHDQWNFTNIVDTKQIDELRLLLDEIQKKGITNSTIE